MKVINLDKFRTHQTVLLDGKEYTVRGQTVSQFLDEAGGNLDALDTVGRFKYYLARLGEITDIPMEILQKQEIGVLIALMRVSQGVDVDEDESGESVSESPEKK